MKITLVRPYFSNNPYEPPLGPAILAGYLQEKGKEVEILDFEAIGIKTKEQIRKKIKEQNPRIVGISFFTYDRFSAVEVAEVAKELGKIVIAGGIHVTFDPVGTLNAVPSIDIAVLGEGEQTLDELITALEHGTSFEKIKSIAYRKDGKVLVNGYRELIADLDILPMPAYHLLPMDKYPYHQILGSRGCPYNCIFCASPEFWRRKVRFRSPEKVADEIEYLVNNYGNKEFDFKDDVLFINREWTRKLCNEIVKRKLEIKWNCLGRVDVIDKDLFRLMRKQWPRRIS